MIYIIYLILKAIFKHVQELSLNPLQVYLKRNSALNCYGLIVFLVHLI